MALSYTTGVASTTVVDHVSVGNEREGHRGRVD